MTNFDELIAATDFGVVANYLRRSDSKIDFILHAKSAALLPQVAERLATDFAASGWSRMVGRGQFGRYVSDLLVEFDLRISSRNPLSRIPAELQLATPDIPRLAPSQGLYLPPFYLAHTPGLFEGKLVRPKLELPVALKQANGIKM